MSKHLFFATQPLIWLVVTIACGLNYPSMTVADDEPARVLIVTGVDYPGHPWRIQAIELRKALQASPQIDVRLAEDIEILGTDLIFDYDVVFLNLKNYDPLKREETARNNLLRFIREGGGLMYFHFTGGAFEDWPEYQQIAGRVWNPAFRGHDPYQEFTVRIIQKEHPIMQGISDFRVTDELYTCLDGQREIEVLAEAKSSVDNQMYPMAFIFTEGKGRGFHTVLGHDAKAFASPELTTLLQNAALWCAKRESLIPAAPSKAGVAANRIEQVVASLPENATLLAYLDCGGTEQLEQGLKIIVADGVKPYQYSDKSLPEGAFASQTSVLFDRQQIDFTIEGLDREKKYQLNVVWWDFDGNGRCQSLIAKSSNQTMVKILRPGTSLPDYLVSGLPPKTVSLPLPLAFVRDGQLVLSVTNEGGPNAVVSELWICELP